MSAAPPCAIHSQHQGQHGDTQDVQSSIEERILLQRIYMLSLPRTISSSNNDPWQRPIFAIKKSLYFSRECHVGLMHSCPRLARCLRFRTVSHTPKLTMPPNFMRECRVNLVPLCPRLTRASDSGQFAPGVYDNSGLQLTDLEREVLELRSQDRYQEMVHEAAKLVEPADVSRPCPLLR